MSIVFKTGSLLIVSNIFMTFAWYAHLKNFHNSKWYFAVAAAWGLPFFEYLFQVPANRIGFQSLSLAQLKVMQEVITLSVFVPFAFFYMHQPLKVQLSVCGDLSDGRGLFHVQVKA
ncbi:MAG TPA: DMT family protein [Pyrinomonadaceae bacterium]